MHTTGEIARLLGATLQGPDDLPIEGLETIDRAGPGCLTFVRSAAYAKALAASRAAAAIVHRGVEVPGFDTARRALLVVPNADLALVKVLNLFAPAHHAPAPGVHPSATVHPGALIDPTAAVGPSCVVGPGAQVGPGAVLIAQVFVGAGAAVGAQSVLHPGVVVGERCRVGARCLLHPGVKLGADGFGYVPSEDGRGVVKVPHIGNVDVHDGVEIGANSCIDRAKFGATTIGAHTKIDNLVQIGHNCTVGKGCLICGQTGIAGSVTLGDGVILAARVGLADNITVGAGARVGAASGVGEDIPPGETWLGTPAMPVVTTARIYAARKKLPELLERLRELEKLAQRDAALPS